MRLPFAVALALPLMALAQEQIPLMDRLQGYFDQAQNFVKGSTPLKSATQKAAHASVTTLTLDNWQSTLHHSGAMTNDNSPEPWMVFVTGGNKTCRGQCGRADDAWSEAVTYLATDPSAPKLAELDCEDQEVLCGAWATLTACVWFIRVPQPLPDQSKAATAINIFQFNHTTITADDIIKVHTRKQYLATPQYESVLHPFDGLIAQYHLTLPMAYFLFGMSKIPSWMFMIGVSFFSRYFVGKRMPRGFDPAAEQREAARNAAPAGRR